ncbi:MAG TPA: hypothetical protein VMG59_01520 [Phycisphaerae bacterium]|nr:hypothetical protein [Phycisphaerae bacterium]
METEERHELQKNDLLGVTMQIYVFLRDYGAYLLLLVALGILGFELLRIHQVNQERKMQQAWSDLNQADTPQKIQDTVISQYSFPAVLAQAYDQIGFFYLGTINLGNPAAGVNGVKVTRDGAISAAEQAFNTVLENYPDQSLAAARAQMGLALTYEDAGEWDQAAAIYKNMLSDQATPMEKAFAPMAQYRLVHLDGWSQPPLVGPPVAIAPATRPAVNSSELQSLEQP